MELAPGNVVDSAITIEMTEEDIAELRSLYDLDKPMIYRYGKYMMNLLRGDLGTSLITHEKIWDTYLYRLPNTLKLSLLGMIIGVSCAIPLGIRSAIHAGSISDNITTVFVVIGVSMPVFWLALLLLNWFSFHLGWLPTGASTGGQGGIKEYILPAVCSALILLASGTRQTRSSMLEVLKADYLRTARAKGVPENKVINKHALGNALIPIVTVIGTSLSFSLAGSVVIEQVFSWPGVGRMAVEAVQVRDTTTVLGTVLLTSTFYVLIQIVVDIVYGFVDPRIKSRYVKAKKIKKSRADMSIS
jgi:peptide/nickel transport system permease protein